MPSPATQRLVGNKAKAIVDDAYARNYAVPTVCCYNLEGILATVRAAEAKRSPAIVQLFPVAIDFAGGVMLHAAADAAAAAAASMPVAAHMDHAQTPDIIGRAADLGGFDGIMVDMSHYACDENLRLSRALVAYCNARGILAECEAGRINGGEDGVADHHDGDADAGHAGCRRDEHGLDAVDRQGRIGHSGLMGKRCKCAL